MKKSLLFWQTLINDYPERINHIEIENCLWCKRARLVIGRMNKIARELATQKKERQKKIITKASRNQKRNANSVMHKTLLFTEIDRWMARDSWFVPKIQF